MLFRSASSPVLSPSAWKNAPAPHRYSLRPPPARTHEEIVAARGAWEESLRAGPAGGRRFGPVSGYPGDAIPAPVLPTVRLKARDRHGTTEA